MMEKINYSKLHSLSIRKIISALIKDGFYLDEKIIAIYLILPRQKLKVKLNCQRLTSTLLLSFVVSEKNKVGPIFSYYFG